MCIRDRRILFCSCEGRACEHCTHSTAEYTKEASEYIGCCACISYKPPLMTIGQDAQRSQLASDSHQLAMLIVFVLLIHAIVAWSRWRAMIRQIKRMNNGLAQCLTQNIRPRLFFQEFKILVMATNVTKTLLLWMSHLPLSCTVFSRLCKFSLQHGLP